MRYPDVTELAARQACPLDGVFAFLDPLLGRAALIVECDDPLGGSAQVGYNEPDARVQLTRMPLDLGNDAAGFVPGRGLIAEAGRRKAAMIIARIKAGEDLSPPSSVTVAKLTVADLAERYLKEHAEVHCKPRTKEAYRWLVTKFVLPELGKLAICEVEREHIAALHYRHRETPYQANRILEVARKMFGLAEAWGLRRDGGNPCRFVQKYKEQKRERFLSDHEFRRLGRVLAEVEADGSESLAAVTAVRLLMLTGCRLSEVQTLRWEDVDLAAGELRLRDSKTGARMVPLSKAATAVLSSLPRDADNPWVIAGKKPGAHLTDLQHPWRRIRARAELDDVRIHDLRHSFASRALALGESLPMIGKLLGHTQVQTTARYAHLANESVKASGSRSPTASAQQIFWCETPRTMPREAVFATRDIACRQHQPVELLPRTL